MSTRRRRPAGSSSSGRTTTPSPASPCSRLRPRSRHLVAAFGGEEPAGSPAGRKADAGGPSLTAEDYIGIQDLVARYPFALDADTDERRVVREPVHAGRGLPPAAHRRTGQPREAGRRATARPAVCEALHREPRHRSGAWRRDRQGIPRRRRHRRAGQTRQGVPGRTLRRHVREDRRGLAIQDADVRHGEARNASAVASGFQARDVAR